jgi:hypothetical protein
VLLAEVLATPLSAYMMTFEPAYPFVLGLILVISGSLPILLLPETLEDAKAKQLSQQKVNANVTDSESEIEPTEPLDKAVLPELLRQIREFKDSTQFIWRDWNICLMVFTMIVGVMTRQSTNMLLQYSSKKFHWSLARVWMPAQCETIFADYSTGQPSDLIAGDLPTSQLSRVDATSDLHRPQILQPAWEIPRPPIKPGQRHTVSHRLCRRGSRPRPRLPGLWTRHPVARVGLHDYHTQSSHLPCSTRPRWNVVLGHWSLVLDRHVHCRPLIRLSVQARDASWQCMDGDALPAGVPLLLGRYGRRVVGSDGPVNAR